jgi:iduronate 2-sulfatase
LEDPSRPGKEAAFTLVTRGAGQSGQSVRTQHWRYTRWSDGTAELYDHQVDPEETHDIAADPAHADLVRGHARLLDALPPLRQ